MNFNQAYNSYYKKVLSYVSFKINSNEIGEEITQDVFMKVYTNFDKYDESKAELQTWIFNIAKNAIIDYWRKVKLETTSISQVNEEGKEIIQVADNETPLSSFLKDEYAELLDNYLNLLPQKYRQTATLFYKDEFTYREIAAELGIKLSTVKIRLLRAKNMLRENIVNIKSLY